MPIDLTVNIQTQTHVGISSRARVVHGFFRTAGAALAVFAILNAAGDIFIDRFGIDFIWILFPRALAIPGRIVLLGAAATLLWTAFGPARTRRFAIACEILLAVVALAAVWNALSFWALVIRGNIVTCFR